MKASELVAQLTHLICEHGDREVLFDCGSIHAALSSVDVYLEPQGAGMSFVVYQHIGEEVRPIQLVPGAEAYYR